MIKNLYLPDNINHINFLAMKKLTLLFLFLGIAANAQIKKIETTKAEEIGKITPGGVWAMSCEKRGNTYYFEYKDATYQHITEHKTFKIEDIDNAFESLYGIVMQGFEDMPEEAIMLEFPDGFLWLRYEKFLGAPILRFGHATSKSEYATIGFSGQFTKKQIQKLFGKYERKKEKKKG